MAFSIDGFLKGKRYLIHARDPLYAAEFLTMLEGAGVKSVRLPARSPNLNAYAERLVRSIKESCLDRMILFGEASLRSAFAPGHLFIRIGRSCPISHEGFSDASSERSA
jgi:hypothetical protein